MRHTPSFAHLDAPARPTAAAQAADLAARIVASGRRARGETNDDRRDDDDAERQADEIGEAVREILGLDEDGDGPDEARRQADEIDKVVRRVLGVDDAEDNDDSTDDGEPVDDDAKASALAKRVLAAGAKARGR